MNHLLITVEESDSSIGFYDLQSEREIGRIRTGFWPHEVEVNSEGTIAYVTNFGIKDYDEFIGDPGASISVIDIQNQCEIKRLYTFRNESEYEQFKAPHGIKLTPAGDKLYVNVESGDGEMLIFDIDSPSIFPAKSIKVPELKDDLPDHQFDIPEGTHNFEFSSDGKFLYLGAGINGLYKLDASTGKVLGQLSLGQGNAVRGIAWTVDEKSLIVSGKGTVSIVDPQELTVIREIMDLGVSQLLYSKPTPDGKYLLCPAVWESKVLVIDLVECNVVKTLEVGVDPIHIKIHPDGEYAYVSHGRSLKVIKLDLTSFEISSEIPTQGGPNGLAIVPLIKGNPKPTLKFGACLPLSGPSSTEGREIRLGYQYWMELVNQAGGIMINNQAHLVSLTFKDTKSRSNTDEDKIFIKKLANELIDEGIKFMLGTYPTPPNGHVSEEIKNKDIPMVTATGAGEVLYNQGHKHLIGIMSPARVYLSGTIELLMNDSSVQDKPKSFCFLSCDDHAALEDAKATALFAKSRGLKQLSPTGGGLDVDPSGVVKYKHLQVSFKKELEAIQKLKPDLFFNTGHLAESMAIVEQLSQIKWNTKGFAFSVGPAIPKFRTALKEKSIGLFGSAQWNESVQIVGHDQFITPQRFAKKFFERFSMPASYFSAGAFACGLVYARALTAAGTTDYNSVISELKDTKMQTFFAKIELDTRGLNDSKPIITVQVQGSDSLKEVPLYPKNIASNVSVIWPFPGWK